MNRKVGIGKPFESYRGDGDYIFASYAHADAGDVYPDLGVLRQAGFNIWYDEGIRPGSRWTSELAESIENCALFIAFLSPAAVESENCTNEIEFAVNRKRPLLVVRAGARQGPLRCGRIFGRRAVGHAQPAAETEHRGVSAQRGCAGAG